MTSFSNALYYGTTDWGHHDGCRCPGTKMLLGLQQLPYALSLSYTMSHMQYAHMTVIKLEQLEHLRSENTPCRPMITHTMDSYQIPCHNSRSDVKPLSLLTGGICDSGRNALTDISRCLPSDDIVHGINSFLCGRFWVPRPALSGAQVVPSHPCRAAVAPLGPGTRRHKSVPARHSDGMSRPAWMIG